MDFPFYLVIVWLALVFAIVITTTRIAAKQKQKQSGSVPRPAATVRRRSAHADDDCEYGDANHEYSHQNDRRLQQLNGYLKAGLIDQKEYREMLERYRRQAQYYDSQY